MRRKMTKVTPRRDLSRKTNALVKRGAKRSKRMQNKDKKSNARRAKNKELINTLQCTLKNLPMTQSLLKGQNCVNCSWKYSSCFKNARRLEEDRRKPTCGETFPQTTRLTSVSAWLGDDAGFFAAALIAHVSTNWSFEESFATFAAHHAVMSSCLQSKTS